MEPLISVIICAYNEDAYLSRCLTSLASQTYKNLEIIIVNDNSWDETAEIIEAWREHSPLRIVELVNESNVGLGASRNRALAIARGEYVTFCDADDFFLDHDYFAQIAILIDQHQPDALITPYIREKFGSLSYDVWQTPGQLASTQAGQFYLSRMFGTHGACAKFFRKNCFDQFKFSEHGFSEDVKCLFNIFINSTKLICARRYGYIYFHNPTSITRKKVFTLLDIYSSIRLLMEIMDTALDYYTRSKHVDISPYMDTWISAHLPIIKSFLEENPNEEALALFLPFRAIINEFARSTKFMEAFQKILPPVSGIPLSSANIDYLNSIMKKWRNWEANPQKIVLYTPSLTSGGLQKVAADMSMALADCGFEVIILADDVETISYPHKGTVLQASFRNIEVLYHLLDCGCFIDLMYNEPSRHYPVLSFMLDNFPQKFVSTLHNTNSMENYLGEIPESVNMDFDRIKYILCVSEDVKSHFSNKFSCAPANLHVLENPIDLVRIDAAPALKEMEPFVLFVGRLNATDHKGIDILLSSYLSSGLCHTHKLVLAGGGNLHPSLAKFCRENNIEDKIILPGFVDNVYGYMKSAAFIFQPSRWEGFCLVNVEALACSCPVLTTSAGNASRAIGHLHNGYITDFDSSCSTEAGIRFMLENSQRLRGNCRSAAEKFSMENYRRRIASLFSLPEQGN